MGSFTGSRDRARDADARNGTIAPWCCRALLTNGDLGVYGQGSPDAPPRDGTSGPIGARTENKMEAAPGFEPGMRVLQTRALPLGDAASVTSQEKRILGIDDPKVNFHSLLL